MIYLLNHASSPLNSFYLPSTCSSSSLGMCYLLMVSYWSCIFSSFFLTFLFFFCLNMIFQDLSSSSSSLSSTFSNILLRISIEFFFFKDMTYWVFVLKILFNSFSKFLFFYACSISYSGDGNWEDWVLRLVQAKSSQ
jgi:hypothetical protein